MTLTKSFNRLTGVYLLTVTKWKWGMLDTLMNGHKTLQ